MLENVERDIAVALCVYLGANGLFYLYEVAMSYMQPVPRGSIDNPVWLAFNLGLDLVVVSICLAGLVMVRWRKRQLRKEDK